MEEFVELFSVEIVLDNACISEFIDSVSINIKIRKYSVCSQILCFNVV